MSELKWATGEPCRPGDVVKWPRFEREDVCTGVGEQMVLCKVKDTSGAEFAIDPKTGSLLRRAGEADDRDREKYEYQEGKPEYKVGSAQQYAGWECCGHSDDWHVWRRLRQPAPAAAPAKPRRMMGNPHVVPTSIHRGEHDEDAACAVGHVCETVDPASAKPPFDPAFAPPGFVAKPCPDGHACVGCHFTLSANNGEECPPRCMAINRPDGQNAIFVKAEAPAKPKFEAVVWPVEREASGACYALSTAHKILAYAGNGFGGFTIAGFFQDRASAETFAENYCREGRNGCGDWETPMIEGNPATFCVATRRTP